MRKGLQKTNLFTHLPVFYRFNTYLFIKYTYTQQIAAINKIVLLK